MGYREQEHADAPTWGLQKIPRTLQRAIKTTAAATGRTITEVMVDELTAIEERLRASPAARSQDPPDLGEEIPFWVIKHFPPDLRRRLKDLAAGEKTPLYQFVIRELWASLGGEAMGE